MTKKELISVIVPCYNQAQYLDECLQSVLDQTYQNWECIIVNDGSPDNTEEIALQWTKKDNRFIYLKKENGGVASARNLGIDTAKGEWILPLDGDDKIGNNYLELASNKFSLDYDLIYCNAKFFGLINTDWNLPDYTYDKMLISNMIFSSAFFKKEKFKEIEGFDINLIYGYEDWEFWINLLNSESKILKLEYVGFYYRRKKVSRNELINENDDKKNISYNYILKKHFDLFANTLKMPYQSLYLQNESLKKENSTYIKILDSKRFKLMNRILNLFNI